MTGERKENEMKQTEITAKIAKFNNDAKKAQLTLELNYDSWNAIPDLAKMVGMTAQVVLYPAQEDFDIFDEN